jgi:hypothetical protein
MQHARMYDTPHPLLRDDIKALDRVGDFILVCTSIVIHDDCRWIAIDRVVSHADMGGTRRQGRMHQRNICSIGA